MIVCGECSGENRKSAWFCAWCGLRLSIRCAVCATDVLPGAEFCDACGTPVGEPADTPAPLGARKVVTVIFADLAGSTSQHEQMDPESVRGFMDAYYAAVRQAVEDENGRVVKLMGDGVMAAFGVPRVSEDDALRAARAALAMQVAFAALADRALQQFGTPVALRVGLNTGEVVVAAGDNDVVGDAVNVAARLQTAAAPGEVIVGESTWRLIRDAVTLDALPPLVVKGKADPVRAYRLVSLTSPSADTPVGTTSFVGRDSELARLTALFDEAVAAGETRVVSVIGSPGVGKSRLSRELAAVLTDRSRVLEAGCPPAGGTTFGPIADLMRQVAALPDDATRGSAHTALLDLLPVDDPDRERVADRAVALLMGGAQATPEELFWATRRLFASVAGEGPLVLMVDDIHWAEPMLLDLIEHLAEWGRDAPIFLVLLARPELRDIRPALAEGGRRVAGVVILEGLGGEASQRLARDLLGAGDLPAAIAGKVLAVTQGNPLFLRELVRMLVEDGILVRDGDRWGTSVDAAELEVPPTVHALLSARIERLDPDERIILERAAVIGSQFPRGGVAAILPPTILDDLDRHLETLRRRELVEPEGTYWGDEPLLRFHHVLIRDAAYRGMLREARADLHERYADWLENKAGEATVDQAEVLGFHLERAHEERQQLSGEALPELGVRAAHWLALAGRRALERDDVGAAAGLLGRALDRMPEDNPERPSLLIDRAEAVLAAGDVTTGVACVKVLQTLAGGSERLQSWAECFDGQLANLTDPSRLNATVTEVSAAAERLAAIEDHAGEAKAHGVRAQALARLGRIAQCEAALDRALAAARQAGDLRRANSVLAGAPLAALWGPSPVARASGKCLDVVRVLRITSGSPAVEATALRCQAVLEALRGRDDAARRMLAAARAALEELGLRSGLLETDLFAGLIDLLAGQPVGAEAHLRHAYEGFRELGVDVDAAQSGALLARALLAQDRDDEALELTVESEQRGGEDLKTAIAWRSARAEALARRGDTAEALRLARQAVTLAEPTDLIIDHADACASLASVLRLSGREAEAAAELRRAADLYERKGATAAGEHTSPTAGEPAGPIHGGTLATIPLNTAARVAERRLELSEAAHWDEVRALIADNFSKSDVRGGLLLRTDGPDSWVEEIRFVYAVPVQFSATPLATRGDTVALERLDWEGDHPNSGPFTGSCLHVTEVDASGRIRWAYLLDADELDAAYAELDRCYLEGEGSAHAAEFELVRSWFAIYGERDWPGFDTVWSPDFQVVDHRPAGWGELDGPGYIRALKGMVELAPDIRTHILAATASENRVVLLLAARGTSITGGPIELSFVMDCQVREGRLVQVDNHPAEHFDALQRPAPDWPMLWNSARDLVYQMWSAGVTGAWDECEALIAPDVLVEDRRSGFQMVATGREVAITELRFILENTELHGEPLAVRGERLALDRIRWTGSSEGDVVVVWEVDAAQHLTARISFDPADLDAAYEELDDRYLALHPDFEGVMVPARAFVRAVNARKWGDVDRVIALDATMTDHRPAGFGSCDHDEYIALLKGLVELAPDVAFRCIAAYAGRPLLAIVAGVGTANEGANVEWQVAVEIDASDGLIHSFEYFPPEQLDELRERQAERGIVVENRASRVAQTADDAAAAGEWDRVRALFDPAIQIEDCRFGSVTSGIDAVVGESQLVTRSLAARDKETLAVRGERLALSRVRFSGVDQFESPFEVEFLQHTELGADGRVVALTHFDADDIAGAIRHLEDRFVAGEGAQFADTYSFEFIEALNAEDWETFASYLGEDFVQVDHTPLGSGTTDKEQFLHLGQRTAELAPDTRFEIAKFFVLSHRGFVCYARRTGSRLGGGESEMGFVILSISRGKQIVRIERFMPEQLDDAMRRYEELTSAIAVDNLAVRVRREAGAPAAAGDWTAFGQRFNPDVRIDDRRSTLRATTSGIDAVVRQFRLTDTVVRDRSAHVIAVRGDRQALEHHRFGVVDEFDSPLEFSFLQLTELDDNGRIASFTIFDTNDIDVAYDEMETRYIATEAPHPEAYRSGLEFIRALNAQDWDGVAAQLTEDFIHVDRTPVGSGTTDKGEFVRLMEQTAELVSDARFHVAVILAAEAWGAVCYCRRTGTRMGGGDTELDSVQVMRSTAGRFRRVERFAADQLDAALRRFEELRPSPELDERYADRLSSEEATAYLAALAVPQAFNAGEIARIADLTNPGFRMVDHTPTSFGDTDTQGWLRIAESLAELAPDTRVAMVEVEVSPNAVLSILNFAGSGMAGGPTETDVVLVAALRDGRHDRIDRYSLDQLDEARARHRELTAVASVDPLVENAVTRLYAPIAGPEALDRHWDYFVGIHANDVVVEARTPSGERYRTEGRDASMAEARSLYDVGLTHLTFDPIAIRGERLALVKFLNRGENAEHGGGVAEVDQLVVVQTNGGGLVSDVVIFEAGEMVQAVAELEARHVRLEGPDAALSPVAGAWAAAVDGRDWDALRKALAHDFVSVDHRLMGWGTIDRDEFVRVIRSLMEVAEDTSTLAARVFRRSPHGMAEMHRAYGPGLAGGGFDIAFIGITRFELTRAKSYELFPLDQLEDALARFDELEAAVTPFERTMARMLAAFVSGDRERFALVHAEDVVQESRRSGLALRLVGREAVVADAINSWELGLTPVAAKVHETLGAYLGIVQVTRRGEAASGGGSITAESITVYETNDDAEITRLTFFDVDDLDAARAEIRARFNARPHSLSRHASDVVLEDRRKGTLTTLRGLDAIRLHYAALDLPHLTYEDIATRGDRLILRHVTRSGNAPHGGGPVEVSFFVLHELNDDDEVAVAVMFDDHDLTAAMREIEERHVALGGDAVGARLRTGFATAYNARDFDALKALTTTDFVAVSHAASWGTVDRDGLVEAFQPLTELVPDLGVVFSTLERQTDRAMLSYLRLRGGTGDADLTFDLYVVAMWTDDGLLTRWEQFWADQQETAVRRYEELTTRVHLHLENAASRATRWEGNRVIGLAEDVVHFDRRKGSLTTIQGRAALDAYTQGLNLPLVQSEVIAIRGERLALRRVTRSGTAPHGGGDAEVSLLVLHELNDDGLVGVSVLFDVDDLANAMREMEERYTDGSAVARRLRSAWTDAYANRDFDALAPLMTENFVGVNHQPTSWDVANREEFIRNQRSLHEVVPDLSMVFSKIVSEEDYGGVVLVRSRSGAPSDGETEFDVCLVATWQPDGLCTRTEQYPPEQVDAALARLEELRATTFERAARSIIRSTIAGEYDGDRFVADVRRLTRMPGSHAEGDIEATLGQRHGVLRWTVGYPAGPASGPWADVGGGSIVQLAAARATPDGRAERIEYFHEGDLLGALIRAEELYAEGEAEGDALVASRSRSAMWRSWQAYGRDWDTVAAAYASDLATHDHRPTSAPPMSSLDEFLAWARTATDFLDDISLGVTAVHRLDDRHVVFSLSGSGTDRLGGGRNEYNFVNWSTLGPGGVVHMEIFPIDAVEEALAAAGGTAAI